MRAPPHTLPPPHSPPPPLYNYRVATDESEDGPFLQNVFIRNLLPHFLKKTIFFSFCSFAYSTQVNPISQSNILALNGSTKNGLRQIGNLNERMSEVASLPSIGIELGCLPATAWKGQRMERNNTERTCCWCWRIRVQDLGVKLVPDLGEKLLFNHLIVPLEPVALKSSPVYFCLLRTLLYMSLFDQQFGPVPGLASRHISSTSLTNI